MENANKILAVDDNVEIAEIMQELLEDQYELRLAYSGGQALSIAEEFQPDLILLDIMMPGMDGYEVCRRLRRNPKLRYTKIIMVTAKALTSERLEGYKVGADDYIIKPFNGAELVAKIKPYLYLKNIEQVDYIERDFAEKLTNKMLTPMTIVKDIVSNAQADAFGEINPQLNDQLNNTNDQIDRLSRIIHDFFDITRIDTGSMELNRTEFDAAELVTETIAEFEFLASQKEITISQDITSESLMLYADRQKIAQTIGNLIENAVKFNRQGGHVHVRLSGVDDQVRIEVEDDGPGLSDDVINTVFSKFVQKIRPTAPGSHGAGLGLLIAKGIVELHGGVITAENKIQDGALFTIELPVCELKEDSFEQSNRMQAAL